jgi:hypothetical protein
MNLFGLAGYGSDDSQAEKQSDQHADEDSQCSETSSSRYDKHLNSYTDACKGCLHFYHVLSKTNHFVVLLAV